MADEKLVKSRQRVADHGEVFTPRWLVDDMLDLVKSETERIDSRFLEPACMRKSGVSRDSPAGLLAARVRAQTNERNAVTSFAPRPRAARRRVRRVLRRSRQVPSNAGS